MITEIITTGTELLLGEIVNENAQWLASFMNEHGYTVAYLTTAGITRNVWKRLSRLLWQERILLSLQADWAQLWEILQRKPELTHWGFHSC